MRRFRNSDLSRRRALRREEKAEAKTLRLARSVAQSAVGADRMCAIANGCHDALMARRGAYYHLHQTQFAREIAHAAAAAG
jgi:hypothetical protein